MSLSMSIGGAGGAANLSDSESNGQFKTTTYSAIFAADHHTPRPWAIALSWHQSLGISTVATSSPVRYDGT